MASPLSSLPPVVTRLSNNIPRSIPAFPSFPAAQTFGIPEPTDVFATPFGGQDDSTDFKVRLVSVLDMTQNAPGKIKQVTFKVTPTISESRSADYTQVQPIHMPGGIQVYKTTSSRTFEITAHFRSRSVSEALANMIDLQILRSWMLPFFGQSNTDYGSSDQLTAVSTNVPQTTEQQYESSAGRIQASSDKTSGINLLGAPPEVLYLYGYSSQQNDDRTSAPGVNINRIPVVMTNLSFSYPEEVDYIPVQISPSVNTEPFPVKMDVNITVMETHSPVEYEQFDLLAFKTGSLKNF